MKALAIGCVAGALSISPRLLLQKVHKSSNVPGMYSESLSWFL